MNSGKVLHSELACGLKLDSGIWDVPNGEAMAKSAHEGVVTRTHADHDCHIVSQTVTGPTEGET